jgi:catalase-peroxidase
MGADIAALKAKILASGLSVPQLVSTAWASASTFRGSDKRGGANGARIRLAPQKDWEVNDPPELAKVLQTLEAIQAEFNGSAGGGKKVSLADLIVLGGARRSRRPRRTPALRGGRLHTGPHGRLAGADRRGLVRAAGADLRRLPQLSAEHEQFMAPEEALVDRAQLLRLTGPEMTVLVGGLRVLGANAGARRPASSPTGSGALTNDFFVNLLDMGVEWSRRRPTTPMRAAIARRGPAVDGHARRPDLRLALRTAGPGGGLCRFRRPGQVRQGDFVRPGTR